MLLNHHRVVAGQVSDAAEAETRLPEDADGGGLEVVSSIRDTHRDERLLGAICDVVDPAAAAVVDDIETAVLHVVPRFGALPRLVVSEPAGEQAHRRPQQPRWATRLVLVVGPEAAVADDHPSGEIDPPSGIVLLPAEQRDALQSRPSDDVDHHETDHRHVEREVFGQLLARQPQWPLTHLSVAFHPFPGESIAVPMVAKAEEDHLDDVSPSDAGRELLLVVLFATRLIEAEPDRQPVLLGELAECLRQAGVIVRDRAVLPSLDLIADDRCSGLHQVFAEPIVEIVADVGGVRSEGPLLEEFHPGLDPMAVPVVRILGGEVSALSIEDRFGLVPCGATTL